MSTNSLSIYGPKLWHTIHTFAADYNPKTDRNSFMMFIISVGELLPCQKCKTHFKQNLKKFPLNQYLDSREKVFLWSYMMHNEVNEMQGKKSPPYKDTKRYFMGKCSKCPVR